MAQKILVVEDEKPMAKVLATKLQKSGFESKAVFNGQEAMAELEANKYDMILLDLMMPKMDGFAVLDALKEKGIKTPVIVTTNLGQEQDERDARERGAIDYLVKANTSMSAIVEKVLGHLKK